MGADLGVGDDAVVGPVLLVLSLDEVFRHAHAHARPVLTLLRPPQPVGLVVLSDYVGRDRDARDEREAVALEVIGAELVGLMPMSMSTSAAAQPLTAFEEAEQLRAMANDLLASDPAFAQDLYVAADRHEGQ